MSNLLILLKNQYNDAFYGIPWFFSSLDSRGIYKCILYKYGLCIHKVLLRASVNLTYSIELIALGLSIIVCEVCIYIFPISTTQSSREARTVMFSIKTTPGPHSLGVCHFSSRKRLLLSSVIYRKTNNFSLT